MDIYQQIVLWSIIILVVYDIVVAVLKKPTISQVIWGWSKKQPIVPFAFGVLMGHLFW